MTQPKQSLFADFALRSSEKREKRKAELVKIFAMANIKYESKHNGTHLLVKSVYGLIDFFPNTGHWIIRKNGLRKHGTQNLINFLNQQH